MRKKNTRLFRNYEKIIRIIDKKKIKKRRPRTEIQHNATGGWGGEGHERRGRGSRGGVGEMALAPGTAMTTWEVPQSPRRDVRVADPRVLQLIPALV